MKKFSEPPRLAPRKCRNCGTPIDDRGPTARTCSKSCYSRYAMEQRKKRADAVRARNREFSTWLVGAANRAGLNASEIARRIGVTSQCVGRWLGGGARPSSATLAKLQAVLETAVVEAAKIAAREAGR